ncbi:maltokinase N-terminal cap-like domain-containing protein (plasmid) [Streptomyces sp. BI20]|uniref:maltokinase N-terminal cap-like domain-containing protein n=1 Tax=Streptomyces sp. BI20 TaxID=3403460 RepID=UPI003C7960C9
MAVIHHTVLKPTKLELLEAWLPTRPWYRAGAGAPVLSKAGGFRLDDPAGEVGIEFMVVADAAAPEPVAYLVPLTYRGAPLAGAEEGLVGTMDHGVLGQRWAYDAGRDPVAVERLAALIAGEATPQHQSASDTPAPEVVGALSADTGPLPTAFPRVVDDAEGTLLTADSGHVLRLRRVLTAGPGPQGRPALGAVTGVWTPSGGGELRGVFATLHEG